MLHLIPRPLHRALLRVAHAVRLRVFRVIQPHLRSATVVALTSDRRMLLIRLSYGSDSWTFPGGGIKRGETPEDAAQRELWEEARCRVANLTCVRVFEDPVLGTTSTGHLFTGTLRDMPVADGREVIEARLFPLHSLPEPLSPKTAKLLAIWQEHRCDVHG